MTQFHLVGATAATLLDEIMQCITCGGAVCCRDGLSLRSAPANGETCMTCKGPTALTMRQQAEATEEYYASH